MGYRRRGPCFCRTTRQKGAHDDVVTKNRQTRLESAWQTSVALGREGSSPVVANGVLFVATNAGLVALDARGGRRLWSSDALGAIHWESPAVSNGAVYCSDESGALTAFALPRKDAEPGGGANGTSGYSMSLSSIFTPALPSWIASRAYAWPSGVATAAQAVA